MKNAALLRSSDQRDQDLTFKTESGNLLNLSFKTKTDTSYFWVFILRSSPELNYLSLNLTTVSKTKILTTLCQWPSDLMSQWLDDLLTIDSSTIDSMRQCACDSVTQYFIKQGSRTDWPGTHWNSDQVTQFPLTQWHLKLIYNWLMDKWLSDPKR